MDTAPLVRMRWRLRGAWQWPSFIVLTLVDAAILKTLPLAGDSSSLVGGWLLSVVISLLAVVLLTPPCGFLVRRRRPDMPRIVARNYAAALITVLVTLALLAGGLAHRHVVSSDRAALADATERAEAYIGAHAPPEFQRNLRTLGTYELQPPDIYRICASAPATRTPSRRQYYCVVVDRSKPFGEGVSYGGSEPNSLLSQGTS